MDLLTKSQINGSFTPLYTNIQEKHILIAFTNILTEMQHFQKFNILSLRHQLVNIF